MTDKGQWIPGVIGNKSHHVTPADEKMKVRDIDGLYVDIGAKSRDEVEALGVGAGNPCVYRPSCECLGENRLCDTSIDNRGGCAVLAALAEDLAMHPRPATVYLVATVQEEFNLRGATLAARRLLPDIAVCLDMAVTGDTPDLWNRFEPALGTGPALGMYYFHGRGTLNGVIAHRGLVNLTISIQCRQFSRKLTKADKKHR